MKVSATLFLLAFLMLFPFTSSAQSYHADVIGDTVILWETGAWRNCGSMYTAEVTQEGFILNWYQVDTGMTATCYCVFDLSVTYGPLEPGDYTARIYYTDAWAPTDTIYEGSVDFTINSQRSGPEGGGVIGNFQSDCYSGQGIADRNADLAFRVFPIPVSLGEMINIESEKVLEDAVLEIFTVTGQKVYSRSYKGPSRILEQINSQSILPGAGIYIFKLSAAEGRSTRLVSILK
jgi:hypothetical protein